MTWRLTVLTRFRPGVWPTLMVSAALLLTVNLGFWQLRRSVDKQALIDAWQAAVSGPALSLQQAETQLNQALPVKARVEGAWVNPPAIVWENRRLEEQQGVQMLQWFELPDALLLVDRGWSRTSVPALSGTDVVTGQLYRLEPAWRAPVLTEQEGIIATPVLDLDTLARQKPVDKPVKPYLLRLHADSAGALRPVGHQHAVMPVRHQGYALTWFGLSLAIVLLYLKWAFRKVKS